MAALFAGLEGESILSNAIPSVLQMSQGSGNGTPTTSATTAMGTPPGEKDASASTVPMPGKGSQFVDQAIGVGLDVAGDILEYAKAKEIAKTRRTKAALKGQSTMSNRYFNSVSTTLAPTKFRSQAAETGFSGFVAGI